MACLCLRARAKARTEALSAGLEVTRHAEGGAVAIHNTRKVTKRYTLTFSNCSHVEFPEGNPCIFTVAPGESLQRRVCKVKGPSNWTYRWTARAVWTGLEDDPQAFGDPEFPADSSSVGESKTKWPNGTPELWVRARVLGDPSEVLLFDSVRPEDVLQGDLGDCWLMSALASLAEYPQQIRKLFKVKHISKDGRYEVLLYDIEALQWQSVVVDEFIPCSLQDGVPQPTFARPLGEEIWALLLEKAVAKYCGSYGALSGGTVGWAFQLLTGEVKIVSYQKLQDGSWRRRLMNREKQLLKGARNPMASWWTWQKSDVKVLLELFETIRWHLSEKHMVTCMISSQSEKVEEATKQGLYKGHFYSLLQARAEKLGEDTLHLVMLRNPWGRKEWCGEWSDGSARWEKHPDLKQRLHSDRADGIFWMSLNDFAEMFSLVYLCPSVVSRQLPPDEVEGEEGDLEEAVAFPE